MAEGIDISLLDDDDSGGAAPGGDIGNKMDESSTILEQIRDAIIEAHKNLVAVLGGGGIGGGDTRGLEGVGAAGATSKGGMFSSALGKASIYLAVFNQAIQGVQKAFGMLQQALAKFADVNAVVAIAFERLQLFLRGVLVVLSEALGPVLNQLTDIFKELITTVLTLFVEVFTLFRPLIMDFLEGIKRMVQWFNRLLGVRPLDIEEQGLRRSATGVANVLSQFANAAANPQGQPAVNVNIQGNEMLDWLQMMEDATAWGRHYAETGREGVGIAGKIGAGLFGLPGLIYTLFGKDS